MGRMNNKVAIVTGGARGLGEAIARTFIAEGAKVVITDVLETHYSSSQNRRPGPYHAASAGIIVKHWQIDNNKDKLWAG